MPTTSSGHNSIAWALLVVASLWAVACGTVAEEDVARGHEPAEGTTREVTNANPGGCSVSDQKVLEQDARSYARDEGISVEEAERRALLENCFTDDLGDLERRLRNEEADIFAGLWVQHEPEYRYVVLFTRDGDKAIQSYLEDEPERFRRLIEVRSGAEATLAELHAAQKEAARLVDEQGIGAEGTGINVEKNRAVVYVINRDRFEAALREANARLPEHVEAVEIEGPLRPG